MVDFAASGSRSTLKAFGIFFLALVAACFAWVHGGWYAIFSLFFLAPIYFLAALVLCGTLQFLMHKYPSYVPSDRIRKPFVVILILLVAQNILIPGLDDSSTGSVYWSIFTGFHRVSGQSVMYSVAGLYYLATNFFIALAFAAFLIVVIQDIRRARSSNVQTRS